MTITVAALIRGAEEDARVLREIGWTPEPGDLELSNKGHDGVASGRPPAILFLRKLVTGRRFHQNYLSSTA